MNIFERMNDDISANFKKVTFLKHSEEGSEEVPMTRDGFKAVINKAKIVGFEEALLQHGINDVEYIQESPEGHWDGVLGYINPVEPWADHVYNSVRKSPFSNVRAIWVGDLTTEDARAKGYLKGKQKAEEVIELLRRSTGPTTVYKYQEMHRDDIIDIDSIDVVAFLKAEMNSKLIEEISRAILIGDGRNVASAHKINEGNIRPIAKDVSPFVISVTNTYATGTRRERKTVKFMDSVVRAMAEYRGSGVPTLYTSQSRLSDMKLLKDRIGRPLYRSEDEIAQYLGVADIVPVPYIGTEKFVVNEVEYDLDAIIVNLADYTLGARKEGHIKFFDGFKIEFNKYQYLVETRCSGALTKPMSAIVIKSLEDDDIDDDDDEPNGDGGDGTGDDPLDP